MFGIRKLEPVAVPTTGHVTLSSKIVLGSLIERLYLDFKGTTFTFAMMTNITLKANGKVIFGPISAAQLASLQAYLLLQSSTTRLTIDLTEPISKSPIGQFMGGLDTNAAGVQEFTFECDVTGATAPALDIYAQLRPSGHLTAQGLPNGLGGLFRTLLPSIWQPTAALEAPYDLNVGAVARGSLKRIVLFGTVISGFRVKQDGLDRMDLITAAINSYVETDFGRSPQSNMYVYDPTMDGWNFDAVPLATLTGAKTYRATVFQWLLTSSAGGTVTAFFDGYKALGDI